MWLTAPVRGTACHSTAAERPFLRVQPTENGPYLVQGGGLAARKSLLQRREQTTLPHLPPNQMPRRPSPSTALRKQYSLIFQLSLIASLAVVIGIFAMPLRTAGGDYDILDVEHEIVQVEDVEQTRQLDLPPPPPAPPPPVAVPDEVEVETIHLDLDMDLDLDRSVAPPPPPRPPPAVAPPQPEAEEEEIFVVVEQMPELIGGLEAVQALIRYPEMARRANIEGTVHLQFIVDENGNVVDPVVVRGIGGGCDEAALEAVRQVRFHPGVQRGRPVKVRYSIPVRFRLRDQP